MTTILAEVMSWPDATIRIALFAALALIFCTAITGRWPWNRD